MIQEFRMENSNFDNHYTETTPVATKVRVRLDEGLAENKEWTFARYFFIGRRKSADICIRNPHVSRLHTVVFFRNGQWWIQDMKSSNGTYVNGKKIVRYRGHQLGPNTQLRLSKVGPLLHLNIEKVGAEERKEDQRNLKHDEVGRVKLVPESSNFSVFFKSLIKDKRLDFSVFDDTQLKRWRKYLIVVAPVIVFGLLLAGFGAMQNGPNATVTQEDQQTRQVQKDQDKFSAGDAEISSKMMTGGTQKTGIDMETAVRPGDETNDPAIQQQSADLYFNAAKKFADSRHWQAALDQYQRVAKIDPEYPTLNMQIIKMEIESENQQIYEQAVAFIDRGQFQQGIAVLSKIDSNSVYRTEASQLITANEKKIAEDAKKQKQKSVADAQAAKNQIASKAIKRALRHYANGKINASISNLDGVMKASNPADANTKKRAKKVKAQIKNAKILYYRGMKEFDDAQLGLASNTLAQLLRVNKKLIGKKRGYLAGGLGYKIADGYGEQAMEVYAEGDLPKAYTYCKMALKLNKKHSKSLGVKKMLVEKSKELYQNGYILEEYNPEKALEEWKMILKICSSDTVYYKKALAKIGGK